MKDVTAKLTGEVVVFSADSGLSPRPQSRQVLSPLFYAFDATGRHG
jgi:hypothetical protein